MYTYKKYIDIIQDYIFAIKMTRTSTNQSTSSKTAVCTVGVFFGTWILKLSQLKWTKCHPWSAWTLGFASIWAAEVVVVSLRGIAVYWKWKVRGPKLKTDATNKLATCWWHLEKEPGLLLGFFLVDGCSSTELFCLFVIRTCNFCSCAFQAVLESLLLSLRPAISTPWSNAVVFPAFL